jgi:hypothetical protein
MYISDFLYFVILKNMVCLVTGKRPAAEIQAFKWRERWRGGHGGSGVLGLGLPLPVGLTADPGRAI